MSGTPTIGCRSAEALTQLQRLLCFLRHPIYGLGTIGASRWRKEISIPFLQREKEGFDKLVELLKDVIVRHTKVSVAVCSM